MGILGLAPLLKETGIQLPDPRWAAAAAAPAPDGGNTHLLIEGHCHLVATKKSERFNFLSWQDITSSEGLLLDFSHAFADRVLAQRALAPEAAAIVSGHWACIPYSEPRAGLDRAEQVWVWFVPDQFDWKL